MEDLKFKIKSDEHSSWTFSNCNKENGFKIFNGLLVDTFEIKNELRSFKIDVEIRKLDSNINDISPNNRCTNKFIIDCGKLASRDEICTKCSLDCFDTEIIIQCEVLVILPLDLSSNIDVDSFVPFTLGKKSVPYRVGHRGLGQDGEIAVHENTIYGFNRCADLNMDFVELDVHFSKDGKIILFHDFLMDKEFCGKRDLIRNLTYDEIQQQLGSRTSTGLIPTFDQVLSEVSVDIGILVEFKYPLLLVDGRRENLTRSTDSKDCYMPKNEYVDKILETIFRHCALKPRKLVLISFDPDICLLLKLKQSIFPVFCITRGDLLSNCVNHADNRMFNFNNAMAWAKFCGFNGIVSRYHEFLVDNYKDLKDSSLMTFLYGNFPRTRQFYEMTTSNGIDGLIIDDVEDYLKIIA